VNIAGEGCWYLCEPSAEFTGFVSNDGAAVREATNK
jgi:hypothetical protein